MAENIVKRTCKELSISYKELGEAIGYGADIKTIAEAQAILKKYT